MARLSNVLLSFGFGDKIITNDSGSQEIIPALEVQKALLENLYFPGYFQKDAIWQAVNFMQLDHDGVKTEIWKKDAKEVFDEMMRAINESGASQDDPKKFNAEILLDKFLTNSEIFDDEDVENIIYYIGQNAFGRHAGQERHEIVLKEWSEIHREKYLENARKLGFILPVIPPLQKYDETWVQGAARVRAKSRIQYLKKLEDLGIDLGCVRLLTGERELHVELDKMPGESFEDCKKFMLELAQENGIKSDGFEERIEAGAKRTYLKYAVGENRKITETMMAKKLYREIFGHDICNTKVIDAKTKIGQFRPTTASAAYEITCNDLLNRINSGDFKGRAANIMILSSQPFVERQTFTNARVARAEMARLGINQEMVFDGAGDACDSNVAAVHSVFGALIGEGFMREIERHKRPRKCNPDHLNFQTRYKE